MNFDFLNIKINNIYSYGSVVYNTVSEFSDEDYIIVCDKNVDTFSIDNINITLLTSESFQEKLYNHKIDIMECFFVDEKYKQENINFNFILDLNKLRRSISAVCSNSFVKCKKKLEIGEDYIGKKSLFHSLRIADYGIQIAKFGKIIDYTKPQSETLKYESFKVLLDEIMYYPTWNELKDKYQVIANNLRTEFRIVAPLKED